MSLLETLLQNSRYSAGVFEIGTVDSMEYDDLGDGTKIPTGMLRIRLATTGKIVTCPYLTQSGGNSQFFGGLPETNAICILANLGSNESNTYVVLGFIPAPLNVMVAKRREMSQIHQGEIQTQSSTNDGEQNWRGAIVKHDIYGRLVIQSGDDSFKITVGDLLSNEYTDQVLVVKDVITAQNIIYQMSFMDYSDSIDRDGNKIERWHSILKDISGNSAQTIQGSYLITTGKDIKLTSAGTGQYLQMTAAGVELKTLDHIVNATGNIEMNASGQMILAAMLDLGMMASQNILMKAANNILMTAIGMQGRFMADIDLDTTLNPQFGTLGNIYLTALGLITMGDRTAAQPLIRGTAWLQWINTPGLHLDSLGMPITQITTPDLLNPMKVFIP